MIILTLILRVITVTIERLFLVMNIGKITLHNKMKDEFFE